ncbi:uncharacterized protein LOC143359818 [Halictus rubicundus]|uniref:uncharacterized protein LOC143359818 n=1 Tax=Halictus rubicundus TaxID=77578 RepID=UPI0040358251
MKAICYTLQVIPNFCNRVVDKFTNMKRLTNMYYSQYDSSFSSEPYYDSDNSGTYKKLLQSPTHTEFLRHIKRRNDEELLHQLWKQDLRKHTNFAKEIKEQCGIAVDLRDNKVSYIYKPVTNDIHIPGIKFKITFSYIKLLRKWYISLGHSRVPNTVNIYNKFKKGTYNPTGIKVLELVRKWKSLLEVYTRKLLYICKLMDETKETYKDLDFEMNESLTNLKVILKENGWPIGLEKISREDVIIVELELDDNLHVANLTYEYVHGCNVSVKERKICIRKLERKLDIFFNFNLMEAFDIFMNGEISSHTESSKNVLTSTENEL